MARESARRGQRCEQGIAVSGRDGIYHGDATVRAPERLSVILDVALKVVALGPDANRP